MTGNEMDSLGNETGARETETLGTAHSLASFSGVVVHGRGLGRTVGLPTANIDFPAQRTGIAFGVYATIIEVKGKRHRSITNIGAKPTVDSSGNAGIETHIFDFNEDIYGQTVHVEVYAFLRGIMRFGSLAQVKEQTREDERKAIRFFDENGLLA